MGVLERSDVGIRGGLRAEEWTEKGSVAGTGGGREAETRSIPHPRAKSDTVEGLEDY